MPAAETPEILLHFDYGVMNIWEPLRTRGPGTNFDVAAITTSTGYNATVLFWYHPKAR